jgi:two-component system, NtrC family, sensor kinase
MKLRTKFLITIGIVLMLSFSITFYWMSKFQDELVVSHAKQQAQILAQQVILTRKWVADHNGIYLEKRPGVEVNPFLKNPVIFDKNEKMYVLFNPAKVTRILSEYANNYDLWQFRVTSLHPINPENLPDDFEINGLIAFKKDALEIAEIQKLDNERVLRFMVPLKLEPACLECHINNKYKVGDVHGGLSLTISMKHVDAAISKNNRVLIGFAFTAIILTILVLYILFDYIVVKKLKILSNHVAHFPNEEIVPENLLIGSDEISELSRKFQDLSNRLTESQLELEKTREQIYQSEKLAALGRFSAGIAHEINNPLGGMLNCVKGIKEAPEDMELSNRYIGLIEKGLKQIERTLRQLLNFGRKEPLKLREVDVDELIRECFAMMTYNLERITFEFSLNLKSSFLIDGEALKQVVVNIGLNAIQSISKTGIISIESRETEFGITISITDNGEGIKAENMREIFDPFYTTKGVNEGTGLGLSVSYSLVQQMEGDIKVSKAKNKGSCFRIELPHKKSLPRLVRSTV